MSRFTGPLKIEFLDDGRTALLLEPLHWECDEIGSDKPVIVPAGYRSDGASVPRFLWALMPPWGSRSTRAAVLHDFLCACLEKGRQWIGAETRKQCDRQYYLALRALGVPEDEARAAYRVVRLYSIIGWGLLGIRGTGGLTRENDTAPEGAPPPIPREEPADEGV